MLHDYENDFAPGFITAPAHLRIFNFVPIQHRPIVTKTPANQAVQPWAAGVDTLMALVHDPVSLR